MGLYLLREHELREAIASQRHLAQSLGRDLEIAVKSLTSQAIEAVGSDKRLGDVKIKSQLITSGQAAFFSKDDLRGDNGPPISWTELGEGRGEISSFVTLASGIPGFFLRLPVSDGAVNIVELSLSRWYERLGQSLEERGPVLASLVPLQDRNDREVPLFPVGRQLSSNSLVAAGWVESMRPSDGVEAIQLDDGTYIIALHNIPIQRSVAVEGKTKTFSRLILALPHSYIYRQWWRSLLMVITALFFIGIVGPSIVAHYVLTRVKSDQKLLEAIRKIGTGHGAASIQALLDQAAERSADELLREFGVLARVIAENQFRARALTRVMQDLYSCVDQKSILATVLELLCTQCRADVAIFMPITDATGFIWRNHRIEHLNRTDLTVQANKSSDSYKYVFAVHVNNEILGTIYALYTERVSEFVGSLAQGTSALLDLTLGRLEALSNTAFQKSRQRVTSSMRALRESEGASETPSRLVAGFSRSIDDESSGWLEYFEINSGEQTFLTIGDIKGPGEVTGLVALSVTWSVRAIQDILENIIPLDAVRLEELLLQLVSIADRSRSLDGKESEFLVAMLDAKRGEIILINRGFADPIQVSRSASGNVLRVLDDLVLEPLGSDSDSPRQLKPMASRHKLEPGSSLIFYSDGISRANNLRPGTFQRLLARCLESSDNVEKPAELRDEIVAMLRYYLQQPQISQRVNLLCLHVRDKGVATPCESDGSAA